MDDMSGTIRKVEFWPVDLPITDPFVVATGTRTIAENVFLRVTLEEKADPALVCCESVGVISGYFL